MWRKAIAITSVVMLVIAVLAALQFWPGDRFAKAIWATVVLVIHAVFLLVVQSRIPTAWLKNLLKVFAIGCIALALFQWSLIAWNPVILAVVTMASIIVLIALDAIVFVTHL